MLIRTSILFLGITSGHAFADASATRIIRRAESQMRGKSVQALMKMRIRRPDFTRELTVRAWTRAASHALVEILEPVKEIGVTSLRVEDQMWNYLPKTEQTVRVPGSMMLQGWMGSDFTNDDLMKASSITRDYTHKILRRQKLGRDASILIECKPKPGAPVVWGKILYWARVADGLPLMQRYYDEEGVLVRTLSYGKFKKMDDRVIPTVISVHSADAPGQMTVVTYKKVLYDRRLPSRLFAREHLPHTSDQAKNPIAHWYYSPLVPFPQASDAVLSRLKGHPMNSYFFKLGWKNLWRNPRRTGLTMGAIGIAVMALICIHNYYDSFFDGVVRNAIRYHSGHFMVAGNGFSRSKLSGTFLKEPKLILRYLDRHTGIEAASPRVLVTGLLSSPRGSASIAFHGIDPAREKRVTHFHKNLVSGGFWKGSKDKSPIVIGRGLARLLKVSVGQKVVALTQGVDGSVGNELFRVVGIFETESELDNKLAFIPIKNARALLSLPKNAVHYISAVIKEDDRLDSITHETAHAFPRSVEVKSWRDLQKHLTALIELNKTANLIVMCVLVLVAAFGIANTVLMSVLERTREFGMMAALGTFQRELISLVFVETLMLSGVGTGLGALMGAGVTMYFGSVGFDLAWLTSQPLVVNGAIVQTVSYPTVQWGNVGVVCSIVISLSLIASLVPAKFIAELKAAKALRAH